MKPELTQVIWETRNLKMPSYQLEGNFHDLKEIQSLISKKKEEINSKFFIQLRIPAEDIKKVSIAQQAGFILAEMSITTYLELIKVKKDLLENKDSVYRSQLFDSSVESYHIPVKELDSSTKKEILEISMETFSSDRFHMDKNCRKSIADNRIRLWIEEDLFGDNKNYCTVIKKNNVLIGYIIWTNGKFIIGGLSKEQVGEGFGKILYTETLLDAIEEGLESIFTTISVNNIPVLNLYSKLNFSFRDPDYILHFWA